MNYFGKTDMGMRRQNNEDSFYTMSIWGKTGTLLVVCDGMGGHKAGEVASKSAVGAFCDRVATSPCLSADPFNRKFEIKYLLSKGVKDANLRIKRLQQASPEFEGMGTTLVAALIYDNVLYVTNIGDSRLYLISGEIVQQVSHDHSFVQYLVDHKKITREEAKSYPNKNVITKAIGIDNSAEADVFMVNLNTWGSGYILLCTDGLTNYVSDNDLRKVFSKAKMVDPGETGDEDLKFAVNELINMANGGGGSDNITAIAARF